MISITLPPLRERLPDDILLLARHFLSVFSRRYGKGVSRLSRGAESQLLTYSYPGNIRELENVIERAVVLADGDALEASHLPARMRNSRPRSHDAYGRSGLTAAKKRVVEDFERRYILDCLRNTNGNISQAARAARVDVKNFYVKMRKYGIDPHDFKVGANPVGRLLGPQ